MDALERILTFLGRAVRYSPAAIVAIIVAMVIIVPILGLVFSLLFVAAGGDWSFELFWTITIGGGLIGFVLAGAAILKVSGVQNARRKWMTLVITTVMAGILFKGISVIPTAGPIWNMLLWSGFATVVVGTILTVLLGTAQSVRPLFVIGVLLLCVGALSGIGKWGWEKAHARKASVAIAPPVEYQFCWSKPREVRGYRPEVRQRCSTVQINAWNSGLINFSVFYHNGGAREESVFSLNRAEGSGSWRNTGELPGYGVWEELPTPSGTEVKLLGRFKDETEENLWQSFMVLEKSS